jgi:hypothetical protein
MTNVNLTQNNLMNQSENVCEIPNVITQRKAHPIRSEKYSVVTTEDIIKQLMEEAGLVWEKVAEENNTSKYKGFGTHLVRCTHPDFSLGRDDLNRELIPQLYIKNSYHGRTKFEMHVGLFRVFCMNGLILGNKFQTIKIKHIGLTVEEIRAEVEKMKEIFTGEVAPFILSLKEKKLTDAQQLEFAEAALRERVRLNANFIRGVNTQDLLTSVRSEDEGAALWEVLQRVQDNLGLNFRSSPVEIRYEYMAKDKDENDVIKERKVSKLKNIQEVTYMNKFLFDLATKYL